MPEISVVMPAKNEEAGIRGCINKIRAIFAAYQLDGEIIVADNSQDGTPDLARAMGAMVITPPKLGYGNAYRAGIAQASGKYIVIGDADGTYDFSEIPRFLKPLQQNTADFVIGNRFGGVIHDGAMPKLHQHIGNPILTKMLCLLFKTKISDAHCGMRAFTKGAYNRLDLHTEGMEYASEMVIEAARKQLRITEIPIDYLPRYSSSKLQSFRDGWRHIRYMLACWLGAST